MGADPAKTAISRRALLAAGVAVLAVPAVRGAAAATAHRAFVADLAVHDVTLHWKDADGEPYTHLLTLRQALARAGKRVLCITNGGIYGRDLAPLGLHLEQGEVLRELNLGSGGGNFFLKPNGVFSIGAGAAAIADAETFELTAEIVAATQSGPLLFDASGVHPRFLEHSNSRYVRNGVGVRGSGEVVFAITENPVTFWDFASLMRDELECASALYLDGNISLMWSAENNVMPAQWRPFVGMLAVSEI